MSFFSIFSKAAEPGTAEPGAPVPVERPRNWRCELGIFWQDIEEAGSVLKAQRLHRSAAPVQGLGSSTKHLAARHSDLNHGR